MSVDISTPVEEVIESESVNLTWFMHNYDEYVQALAERGERFRFAEVDGRTVVVIERVEEKR